MITITALCTAILLDRIFGEPKVFHPLIGFGNIAMFLERVFNSHRYSHIQSRKHSRAINDNTNATNLNAISTGIFAWLCAIAPIVAFAFYLSPSHPWLYFFTATLAVYLCIAHKSLVQHNQNILSPLDTNDLVGAQRALALIVSRETHTLDKVGVRKAAIESVLENGSDGIFAPIFWFLIFGIPGILLYRCANTLDAMWGYRNERFLYFGRFAARVDDVLNWIPARIVALSYALLGDFSQAIKAWKNQAHLCNSPNAGPVMCAGAGSLNLQLGGPAIYHGKQLNKPQLGFGNPPTNNDLTRAINLVSKTLWLWVIVITFSFTLFNVGYNWH